MFINDFWFAHDGQNHNASEIVKNTQDPQLRLAI
jgi:hypothetical protein